VYGNSMSIMASTQEVLEILKENRSRHSKIVEEARDGYIKKATKVLSDRLKLLRKGKLVSVTVALSMPVDHTSEYNTAIRMLELHKQPEIVLTTDQVRAFIEDKWNWSGQFLGTNALYSDSAHDLLNSVNVSPDYAYVGLAAINSEHGDND